MERKLRIFGILACTAPLLCARPVYMCPLNLQEERVKLDIEEAKLQAQKRKEALDRAKTLQYYQTDRVKEFHVRFYIFYVSLFCFLVIVQAYVKCQLAFKVAVGHGKEYLQC